MTTTQPDAVTPLTPTEEARWTSLAHLSGLLSFVGPLLVWLILRDRSDAVEREAKESLNFQIAAAGVALALYIIGSVLSVVVVGIAFLMLAPLVQLAALVFAIVGAVRANSSGSYRYPLTLRFVR